MKQAKFQPVIGFEETSSLRFKTFDNDVILRFKEMVREVAEDNNVEDRESNMLRTNGHSCRDPDEVIEFIRSIWQSDYSDNEFRSEREGWDFYYFVPKALLKGSLLLIIVNLHYPSAEFENNVLYNLVAIKTDGSSYLVWDMTT